MAAPHVSAAAALVMAADPALSGPQVATLIRQTAAPLASGSASYRRRFSERGRGRQSGRHPGAPGHARRLSAGRVERWASSALGWPSPEAPWPVNAWCSPSSGRPNDRMGSAIGWLAGNGSVFAFGDAHFYGSAANMHLAHPITAWPPRPDGKGYWLVAKDGGVFAFGDARFYGSATKIALASGPALAPIVDIAATPDGKGYWLVGQYRARPCLRGRSLYGPPAAMHFAYAVSGMAVTPDGKGYWLVAKDGGVFAFGDATFYGSGAGKPLAHPVVGMAVSPFGLGYWLVEAGGQVLAFGSAPYEVAAAKVTRQRR